MASNHLNAGAASFTPGGPPAAATGMIPDDSFSAYMDFVDDIHDAMDDDAIDDDASNEGFTEPPPLPISESVSGLPPHLAKHASEFWFPESRDCPTCQGFKYGCRASNDGICPTCCPGGVVGGPPSSLKPQGPSNQSRVPPGGGMQGRGRDGRDRNGVDKAICKFFRSPNGCRFGDGCRFLHVC
jgi:CCCH-type zinc finger